MPSYAFVYYGSLVTTPHEDESYVIHPYVSNALASVKKIIPHSLSDESYAGVHSTHYSII